jgi:hypothetical protein
VWFAGVHSDVGGGYKPDKNKRLLSDIPLEWLVSEAEKSGLELEDHLRSSLRGDPAAQQNESYSGFFKVLGKRERRIPASTYLHKSVKARWEAMPDYRPKPLVKFVEKYGWDKVLPD